MLQKLKKQTSNIIFVIAIVLLIVPTSREWIMRQLAFSPSINDTEEMEHIDSYDWSLKGLNTSDYNLEEAKGKVVFVNFWATWCPSCRAELPMIQALYNDYKDKVVFLFVTNESHKEVNEFYEKGGYNLPTYTSRSIPPSIFTKTNKIPASYLIDKNGNIVIDKVGAADWNTNKIRSLIDELVK